MLAKESIRRIEFKDGIWYVNNSGLDLIQTCPRKALYVLSRPETDTSSIAQDFGTSAHAALALFYQTLDRPESLLQKMIEVFNENASPAMKAIEEGEIHSLSNGAAILKTFYDAYKNDPWKVYVDDQGPFVERKFEVKIQDNLYFFGTIDTMLQHSETGELCIVDHKAVRSLGNQFATKGDVNHQLTGYVFACQQMGIKVDRAMFQGLKKVKTLKSMEVMRAFVPRNEENITEWKQWVFHTITMWQLMHKTNNFPMNGSYECNKFSGCQYLSVCAAPNELRAGILDGMNNKSEEVEE